MSGDALSRPPVRMKSSPLVWSRPSTNDSHGAPRDASARARICRSSSSVIVSFTSAECPLRRASARAITRPEQRARDRQIWRGGQDGLAKRRVFQRTILYTSHAVNEAPMTTAGSDQVVRARTSTISTSNRCKRFWRHRIWSVNQSRSTPSSYCSPPDDAEQSSYGASAA